MMGAGKGNSCCLKWQELLSCVHLAIQLLISGTYEFGHDADQSQHSAFGLIGKDGPLRIIKICYGNMILLFGSEVAQLGFWEYIVCLEFS
jgi:hypothetical protein